MLWVLIEVCRARVSVGLRQHRRVIIYGMLCFCVALCSLQWFDGLRFGGGVWAVILFDILFALNLMVRLIALRDQPAIEASVTEWITCLLSPGGSKAQCGERPTATEH